MPWEAVVSYLPEIIGAAGAVYGSVSGSSNSKKASKKASKQQEQAANDAISEQRREYDQTRSDQADYRATGSAALGQIRDLAGPGGEFNRSFSLSDFNRDPGYQFRMDEGQRAVENSASARMGNLGGAAAKGIARYGQDYASNEYSNAYNRFNNDRTTRYNRLASMAGIGQTATNVLGDQNGRTSASLADLYLQRGNARAAGTVGAANAGGNPYSTIGSVLQTTDWQGLRDLFPSQQTPARQLSDPQPFNVPDVAPQTNFDIQPPNVVIGP